MRNRIFKNLLLCVIAVCISFGNIAAYAAEETVQKTEQLLNGNNITVNAGKSTTINTYMPFITEGVTLTHNSYALSRKINITFTETGSSVGVPIARNTTQTTVTLSQPESRGKRTIELENTSTLGAVQINSITALRDEDKYFYGTLSDFAEIDYTPNEAALQTAAVFSDNSSLCLIRNARRYLSTEDISLKPVRENNQTYVTQDAVREALRVLVEENADGSVIVKEKDIGELVFTSSGCTFINGDEQTDGQYAYIVRNEKKLLPITYIADIFGMEAYYSDGLTVIDEKHRIDGIKNNSDLTAYIKGRIDVVQSINGNVLHVSQNHPNANDENDGTEEMPYKTINAAAAVAKAGDKIIVHEGIYRETVTPKNDGVPGAPIVIEGADGEDVTVSGADEITKMAKYKDNTYFAKVPEAKEFRNQVFINGEAYAQGRHPNAPNVDGRIAMSDYVDLCQLWPMEGDISNSDNLNKFVLTSEKSLTEKKKNYWKYSVFQGLVHEGWETVAGMVEESSEGNIRLNGKEGVPGGVSFGYLGYSDAYSDTDYGYLTEHVSAVDMPGEWTIKGKTLYIIMPENITPDNAVIEYKARQLLFDLTGRKNITIRNIKGFSGSVNMKDSELCMLDECDFKYISHFTWFADNREGYIDNRNDESETGAQARGEVGIYIGGSDNIVQSCNIDTSAGAGLYIAGKYSYIYNNNLTECGYVGTMCQGIFIAFEPWKVNPANYDCQPCFGGHSVYYNSVSKCGRSPIAINGSYTMLLSQKPTRFAAMDIAYNDFYEGGIMSGRDGGLYYAYGVGVGDDIIKTKFHNNLLWDYYAYDGFDVGIYLDAGNTDSEIYQNTCFYTNEKGAFVTTVRNVGGQDKMPNTNSFDWDNVNLLCKPGGKRTLSESDYAGGVAYKSGSTLSEIGGLTPSAGTENIYYFKTGELSSAITVDGQAIKPSSTQDSVKISGVDFGTESDALKITYEANCYSSSDKIEVRIDSANGTKILSKSLKSTAPDISNRITDTLESAPVSGVHDIYITFPTVNSAKYLSVAPSHMGVRPGDNSSKLIYCGYFDERGNTSGGSLVGYDDTRINGTTAGTWVCYSGRYLKGDFNKVRMSYSTDANHSGNTAKIILDDLNNTPIAELTFNGESWTTACEAKSAINGTISAGLHDIYVLFGGGAASNSNVFELEFLTE